MPRPPRRLALFLLSVALLLGGPVLAAGLQPEPAAAGDGRASAAFERAMEHYQAGKLNEAAGLLRGFLVSHGDSSLAAAANLQLARIHEQLGEPQQALHYLERVPEAARDPESRLLEARLLQQAGASAEAQGRLQAIDPQILGLSLRQEYWLVRGEAATAVGEPQRALYFYYQGLRHEGEESPEAVLARIRTLFDAQFAVGDLEEAAFQYADTPVATLAMLQLGWRALAADQKEQAEQWASAVLQAPVGFAYRDEALTLLSQVAVPGQVQRAIGVLLPLSGRYAAFGELVKRGIELARSSFRPDVPVRFVYHDTAADAAQADRLVAELAVGERVMAVIGPLTGAAASAAAQRANREQVPLLALSQREGLAATGPYVFRNAMSGMLQVRTLAEYASEVRGMTRFAVLYPETRQGNSLAGQFREEVQRRGGTLVGSQGYAADQTDFRRQVRLLLGLDPDAPDDEKAAGKKPKTPPPFDALFIPDDAEHIGLIAPQLVFYGMEGVQLLGTSGWNDPQLVKLAGQFVEGAVFCDGFFRYSPYPFVKEFTERYYAVFGSEPTILEAQGYDAAGILLSLLEQPEVQGREALRRALLNLNNYPGVTGGTRFDTQGEAVKQLFLLQIQDGAIVQIN